MNGIALNEDNSHFFNTRAGQPITVDTVDIFVDQYANTKVEQLLLCPNCMRTSYDSKVFDPIWRGYDPDGADNQPLLASLPPEGRSHARKWIHTAWALNQAGIDVYARWIDRARLHGISPWLTMRMNDLHWVDDEKSYIHSEFWREHSEYRRVPYHFTAWTDRALDYGREEVRDYHFKLIEEMVEHYDFDGLELDWMRFGYHLRPGHEIEGAELLTEFTGKVRRLLDGWEKQRGHKIRLGARVPARPQSALGLGMDAVTWARKGYIDWLVVTPFWASTDTDMPMEIWREMLDGTGVELCAGLEILLRAYPSYPLYQTNSIETVRGAALSLLHRGADRIYLFNYMDSETTIDNRADYQNLLQEIGDIKEMEKKPRRHVITFTDTWAVGEPQSAALPAVIGEGGWHAFRIHIGPRPASGTANVVLAFDAANDVTGDLVELRINGELSVNAEPVKMVKPCPNEPAWRYKVPLTALRDGYNVIELHVNTALTVIWVEIAINSNG
ncbi:MAG: hypothetical protein WCO98_01210 [bacterium]